MTSAAMTDTYEPTSVPEPVNVHRSVMMAGVNVCLHCLRNWPCPDAK